MKRTIITFFLLTLVTTLPLSTSADSSYSNELIEAIGQEIVIDKNILNQLNKDDISYLVDIIKANN